MLNRSDLQAGLQNTNDIKRWASVVSDIDDIQAASENAANTTNTDANEPIDHRTVPLGNKPKRVLLIFFLHLY